MECEFLHLMTVENYLDTAWAGISQLPTVRSNNIIVKEDYTDIIQDYFEENYQITIQNDLINIKPTMQDDSIFVWENYLNTAQDDLMNVETHSTTFQNDSISVRDHINISRDKFIFVKGNRQIAVQNSLVNNEEDHRRRGRPPKLLSENNNSSENNTLNPSDSNLDIHEDMQISYVNMYVKDVVEQIIMFENVKIKSERR
ncbi:18610_t:CDS:2 [Dentiscutata erythropus]|uniref:18610_t:CDS:1 n=1 Tax=Dentiscutata erythropus TaxID=1348616 RepID=A0A9N9CUZ4_9GLOM|nr:18610_t:CDS:2 [Dentiscutata erythropus]